MLCYVYDTTKMYPLLGCDSDVTGTNIVASQCSPRSVITTRKNCLTRLNNSKTSEFPKLYSYYYSLLVLILLFIHPAPNYALGSEPPANGEAKDVPDGCESCKLLVESFEKGMEKTMRGKHEGGDTSWEERNLKSYSDSEVRLVEIQEQLCADVSSKGKAQCFSMAEEAEAHIEEWWFKHRNEQVRLFDYLCISKLKECCIEGAFGPTCQKCPSDCNGHGSCDGSGTRSGTGECVCQASYSGKDCEDCADDHYRINTHGDNSVKQFTCLPCHKACKGGCNGPGAANCTDCLPGYERDPTTNSCVDINECELGPNEIDVKSRRLCPDGTYCLNTDGHYRCADCHRACSTCLGYGRDRCITCSPDHFMDKEHNCLYAGSEEYHPEDETYLGFMLRTTAPLYMMRLVILIVLFNRIKWLLDLTPIGPPARDCVTLGVALYLLSLVSPYVEQMIETNFGRRESEQLVGHEEM